MKPAITIYGAGNVGLTLAGLFSSMGFKVNLVARSNYKALIKGGFTLFGNYFQGRFRKNSDLLISQDSVFNEKGVSILATKMYDIDDCIDMHPEILDSDLILLVQNGFFPEKRIQSISRKMKSDVKDRVYHAIIFGIADNIGDLRVKYNLDKIVLGSSISSFSALNGVLNSLNSSSFLKIVNSREQYMRFHFLKAAYNSVDSLSFLINSNLGSVFKYSELKEMFQRKVKMVVELSKKFGSDISDLNPDIHIENLCTDKFSNHVPSLVMDLRRQIDKFYPEKMQCEIEFTDLAIARVAKRYGLEVKTNRIVGNQIKSFIKKFNLLKSKDYSSAKDFANDWIGNNRRLLCGSTN